MEETRWPSAAGDKPGRRTTNVLDAIEKTGSATSCLSFVGSTLACMHYLGEQASGDYVMAISGGAFALFWHPAFWAGCRDLLSIGEEPARRTFAALGYAYAFFHPLAQPVPDDVEGFVRERVVASVDAGRPAIALGAAGLESSVVAGYDRGGEVLYARGYGPGDAEEYSWIEGWEEDCYGLILIGEKVAWPPRRQILGDTLAWAIRLARGPEFDAGEAGHLLPGLAAYDALADALLQDLDFPTVPEVLRFRCRCVRGDSLELLATRRCAAARFVLGMAQEGEAGAGGLREAAQAYEEECRVLEQAAGLLPSADAPDKEQLKLAGRGLRQELAHRILAAKAHEERALERLGRAYQALAR